MDSIWYLKRGATESGGMQSLEGKLSYPYIAIKRYQLEHFVIF